MKVEDFLEEALRIVVDENKYDLFYVSEKYKTKIKSQYSDAEVNDLVYAKAEELMADEELVVGLTLHFFYPKFQPFHCNHQRQYWLIAAQCHL
jgi:hypothetical protein